MNVQVHVEVVNISATVAEWRIIANRYPKLAQKIADRIDLLNTKNMTRDQKERVECGMDFRFAIGDGARFITGAQNALIVATRSDVPHADQ